MAINGRSTSRTVRTARTVMKWSVMRRRQLICGTSTAVALEFVSGKAFLRLTSGDAPDQEPSERVHDNGNQKQS